MEISGGAAPQDGRTPRPTATSAPHLIHPVLVAVGAGGEWAGEHVQRHRGTSDVRRMRHREARVASVPATGVAGRLRARHPLAARRSHVAHLLHEPVAFAPLDIGNSPGRRCVRVAKRPHAPAQRNGWGDGVSQRGKHRRRTHARGARRRQRVAEPSTYLSVYVGRGTGQRMGSRLRVRFGGTVLATARRFAGALPRRREFAVSAIGDRRAHCRRQHAPAHSRPAASRHASNSGSVIISVTSSAGAGGVGAVGAGQGASESQPASPQRCHC